MIDTVEEEDLPLVDPELLVDSPVADEVRSPAVLPTPAPVRGEDDLLKNYFANQKLQREQLARAEDQANENRFGARLGGALNTIAQAASPKPADNSAFEGMARDANNPVDRIERQQKLDQGGDKLLLNYFMNKNRAAGASDYRNKKLGLEEGRLKATQDRNKTLSRMAEQRLKQTERGLGLRQRAMDLRETSTAAGAAKTINNDKVVTMTEQQLNAANKGLGQLDKIDEGKIKFSTTIKADLEKDLANLISGSNSSALGQLERVEFHPYVAGWQEKLDKIRGYQGDINAPEFKKQLRDQFTELRNDILEIQVKRKERLLKSNKTAYSKAPLAAKAMEEAAGISQEPTTEKKKPVGVLPGSPLSPQDQAAMKWALENPTDKRAIAIMERLKGKK
jgi:hypothetical protein